MENRCRLRRLNGQDYRRQDMAVAHLAAHPAAAPGGPVGENNPERCHKSARFGIEVHGVEIEKRLMPGIKSLIDRLLCGEQTNQPGRTVPDPVPFRRTGDKPGQIERSVTFSRFKIQSQAAGIFCRRDGGRRMRVGVGDGPNKARRPDRCAIRAGEHRLLRMAKSLHRAPGGRAPQSKCCAPQCVGGSGQGRKLFGMRRFRSGYSDRGHCKACPLRERGNELTHIRNAFNRIDVLPSTPAYGSSDPAVNRSDRRPDHRRGRGRAARGVFQGPAGERNAVLQHTGLYIP